MSYREMLLKMQGKDLDPRLRHTFDLYMCLPTKRATHKVTKYARRFGFTVEIIPGARHGTWFCIATKISPSPGGPWLWDWKTWRDWRDRLSLIALCCDAFDYLAREQGGYFHGWEVDIPRPRSQDGLTNPMQPTRDSLDSMLDVIGAGG